MTRRQTPRQPANGSRDNGAPSSNPAMRTRRPGRPKQVASGRHDRKNSRTRGKRSAARGLKIAEILERLHTLRRELAEEREHFAFDLCSNGEATPEGDDAVKRSSHSIVVSSMAHLVRNLVQIDAALERIAEGSYGVCPDCGKSIPHERLMVNPTALRCTRCQDQLEQNAH